MGTLLVIIIGIMYYWHLGQRPGGTDLLTMRRAAMYINSLAQNIDSVKVETSPAETLSFGLEVGGRRLESGINSEGPLRRP